MTDRSASEQLFICYAHDDAETVLADSAWLQSQGYSPWVDQAIRGGEDWPDALAGALDECVALLFFVSRRSMVSPHCLNEVAYAVDAGKPIIVVFLEATELAGGIKLFVARTQAIVRWQLAVDEYHQQLRHALRSPAYARPPQAREVAAHIWQVPLRRNRRFAGRERLLDSLHEQFQTLPDSLAIVLSGLAGIGKSQTALEFAYRHGDGFRLVGWLRAEEAATLNADLVSVARQLGIADDDDTDIPAIIEEVKQWLARHHDWLLVFDNVEVPDLITDYLPGQFHGKVLITSRRQNWGQWVQRLEMDAFSQSEATDFILARTSQADPTAASDLARLLGCLPLALEEAVAYMEATGRSIPSYLQLLNEHHDVLFAQGQASSDYPGTLRTAFEVSLRQLASDDTLAARLLDMLAFVAPDDIPRDLCEALLADIGQEQNHSLLLDRCLSALRRFSLVHVHGDAASVHRVVQLVSRDRMSGEAREQLAAVLLRKIESQFPQIRDLRGEAARCTRLLPHAVAVLGHAGTIPSEAKTAALLWGRTGTFLTARNHAHEGTKHLENAYRLVAQQPDQQHQIARTGELYGRALYYGGQLERACNVHREALSAYRATEGDGSFHVMQIHVDLAWFEWTRGDFAEAQRNCECALEEVRRAAGADDPRAMAVWSILARVQFERGQIEAARRTAETTIAAIEKLQGFRTPLMCGVFLQVAQVLLKLGLPLRAQSWARESLNLGKAIFSDHHALMSASSCVLGQALAALGEDPQAVSALTATTEAVRRTTHPLNQDVCVAPCLLADALLAAGDVEQARSLADEARSVLEHRIAGEGTLARVHGALLQAKLTARDRKEPLAAKMIADADRSLVRRYGDAHPYRLPALLALGEVELQRGNIDAASAAHELGLDIGRRLDLTLHPMIAHHSLGLAEIATRRTDVARATKLRNAALDIYRQRLGPTSKPALALS